MSGNVSASYLPQHVDFSNDTHRTQWTPLNITQQFICHKPKFYPTWPYARQSSGLSSHYLSREFLSPQFLLRTSVTKKCSKLSLLKVFRQEKQVRAMKLCLVVFCYYEISVTPKATQASYFDMSQYPCLSTQCFVNKDSTMLSRYNQISVVLSNFHSMAILPT